MGNKINKKKKLAKYKLRCMKKAVSALLPRNAKGIFTAKQHNEQILSVVDNRNEGSLHLPENTSAEGQVTDANGISRQNEDGISLIVENENCSENEFRPVTGRRILDINYVLDELQKKTRHNQLFNCNTSNFRLVSEKRQGLESIFKFQCNMCREVFFINTENPNSENLNLNLAATTGIVSSGIGYSQFQEICSAMDIPVFSPKSYSKLETETYEKWEKTASSSMSAAAKKERDIAIEEGRIVNGYPMIDVYVDGSWCARSYGSNYKASSGTAAIIGRKTGQVLYIGVKNKYCLVCARAANKNTPAKDHKCFKNYNGSSSSMETEIIVEGFKSSIATYGLIYGRLIGDGDASTYAKILQARPYATQNVTVEKIECRNHILRNFCKKLRGLTTETKYMLAHRKTLTNVKILTMRKVIVQSIRHHKVSTNPKNLAISVLHNDIINSVAHAYGDHKMCKDYYCVKEKNDNGEFKKIQDSTFIFRINAIISNVAAKSRSLIEDVSTNTVECFNSVIAKFIGGKRINFSLKGSYQGRCSAAVVSFNTKSALSAVQEAFVGKQSGKEVENLEKKRNRKRKLNLEHPTVKRRRFKEINQKQHDYGLASETPDMSLQDLKTAKEDFLKNLQSLTCDRQAIERTTVLQRDCSEWLEIRKNLVTASNFGPICKRRGTLGTAPLVKNLLYKQNLSQIASIAHGIEHEKQALLQLEKQENINIMPCGLFIDQNYCFLGATPDGLVGGDAIVEVKCPITASKKGLTNAIQENKIQILKYDKKLKSVSINKKSNWYYQIQGQLHITGRRLCFLGIWSGENESLLVKQIERDDDYWRINMEPKLIQFYQKCLLPEIVDSRQARGMPIRNIPIEGQEISCITNLADRTPKHMPDKENVCLDTPTTLNKPGINFAWPKTRVLSVEEF